jgi:hypothetical protein
MNVDRITAAMAPQNQKSMRRRRVREVHSSISSSTNNTRTRFIASQARLLHSFSLTTLGRMSGTVVSEHKSFDFTTIAGYPKLRVISASARLTLFLRTA